MITYLRRQIMTPTMVRVEWIDSGMSRANGWESLEKCIEGLGLAAAPVRSMEVVTVGLLMHEDDDHIVVAQSYDRHNESWFSTQVIWRPALVKMEPLLTVSIPESRDDG